MVFYEEEKELSLSRDYEAQDRKSELNRPESTAVRVLGSIIMIVSVPYYLFKAYRSN